METIREGGSHTSGSFLALITLLVLTVGVSFLPASWFGVHQDVRKYTPLNLGTSDSIQMASNNFDASGSSTPSWKSFIAGSLGVQSSVLQAASSSFQADPREIADLNDPNNLTSSFSKNLYIASVALQQNGINDPSTDQQTITQLLKEETSKVRPTNYTQKDIKLGTNDSSMALKTYGNTMASILNGVVTENSMTSDLESILNFTNSKDEGDLSPIAKSTSRVGATLDKLLAVTVPPSAASLHVDILNRVGTLDSTLRDISRAYDDPIRATLAIQNYSDNTVHTLQSFPLLANFFKSKNITFTAKESGYVYIVGYTGK